MIEVTEKEIHTKIYQIARVLGNALRDIEELAAKVESGQTPDEKKRRNLKQQRVDEYRYKIASGQMRRKKKPLIK